MCPSDNRPENACISSRGGDSQVSIISFLLTASRLSWDRLISTEGYYSAAGYKSKNSCDYNGTSAMFQSLKSHFIIPKFFNMSWTSAQVHLHRNLSQQGIPQVFRLERLEGLDLYENSVEEIQQYLSEGRFTSVDYVKFCLRRIHLVNPYLECIIEVNPDAVEIAARLDEERRHVGDAFDLKSMRRGCTSKELSWLHVQEALISKLLQHKARGILHGVPILVKDNMATKDKMETTAGSWALLGSKVSASSKRCFFNEQCRALRPI